MNKSPFDVPPNPPAGKSAPNGGLRLAPFWKRSMDDASADVGEPFDALADLFLGEIGPREGVARANAQASRGAMPSTPAEDAPRLRLAGSEDDAHEQPVEHAVPRAASQENIQTRPAAPVLALASDEAGEAKAVAVTLPPPVRNPVLECVVLANLPVMGAAWASQYAREVASAAGKLVACLRVEGDFVRLELVGTPPEGVTLPAAEDVTTLEWAVDAAAEVTDRWIVRCDAGQENIVAACAITRAITVLSGADPMAREACRPVFERLASVLGAPVEGAEGPMVRLALMGVAEGEAKAIGAELSSVAQAAIGRTVTPVACSAKIGAAKSAHALFSGTSDSGLRSMLALVERAVGPDTAGAPVFAEAKDFGAVATVPSAPARIEQVREDLESRPELAPVELEPVSASMMHAVAAHAAPSLAHATGSRAAGATPTPAPTPTPTIAAPTRSVPAVEQVNQPEMPPVRRASETAVPAGPLLASHLAELKPLAFKCPYAETIELATDAAGMLHLLASSAGEHSDESILASLLMASSWAEAHSSLLAAAAHVRPEFATKATLHLFTDRPKHSRRLLDTPVRVHLLAPVSVGGQTAWYCTELN